MSIRIVSRKVEPLDENLAKRVRDLPALRNDRPLKGHRLRRHMRRVENGTFFDVTLGILNCKEDGVTYRVNGNHVTNMVCLLQQMEKGALDAKAEQALSLMTLPNDYEFPAAPTVRALVQTLECDTNKEKATVFGYYDSPDCVRTSTDQLGVSAAEYADFDGVLAVDILKAMRGLTDYLKSAKKAQPFGIQDLELPAARDQRLLLGYPEIREAIKHLLTIEDALILNNKIAVSLLAEKLDRYGIEGLKAGLAELEAQDAKNQDPGKDLMDRIRKWATQRARQSKPASLKIAGRKALDQIFAKIKAEPIQRDLELQDAAAE